MAAAEEGVLLSRRGFLATLASAGAALGLAACASGGEGSGSFAAATTSAEPLIATVYDTPAEGAPAQSTAPVSEGTATLMMVGDMLMHQGVWESGRQADGSYNFDHFFVHLADEFANSDIAMVNQETILGGTKWPYSSFPHFNSPQELGDAEVKVGVDAVTSATNHAMDMGYEGIEADLEYWRSKHPEIEVLGIADSQECADAVHIIERNGIKVGMVNYCHGLNDGALSGSISYAVKQFDTSDIAGDVARTREAGADVVVAFVHWGTEYTYSPSDRQWSRANQLLDAGVDAIIGGHPHVIQNTDVLEGEGGKQVPVWWSLGNFVSWQIESPRMVGGMAKLTFQKTAEGTKVVDWSMTPLVTHKSLDTNFSVYKLSEYTEELACQNGIRTHDGCSDFSLQFCRDLAAQVLGSDYNQETCTIGGQINA